MTHFKSPEDMTMDEIKQQLALYQRLYNKRKEDEQFMQKKHEARLRHNQKKKLKEYSGKKRGAPKYDMNEYKVIMPNAV